MKLAQFVHHACFYPMVLLLARQGLGLRRLLHIGALVALVSAGGGHASYAAVQPSAEDVEEAKARFAAGNKAFERGEYREAVGEFQGGFMLTRSAGFLLNIAVCYRRLGETQQALDNFRDYLKAEPKSPRRAEVEKQIAEIEAATSPAAKPAAPTGPARLADGSLDPAAAPVPVSKPAAVRTPPEKTVRPAVPVPTSTGPRVDSADEDDGVSLVVTRRRPGAPPPVRASKKAAPADDEVPESKNGGHKWLWAALGAAVIAGVVVAFATSDGKTQSGSLGSVDLR